MKTKILAVWLISVATLAAAPLTETTAVHTQPDSAAPAISYLKAGTEPKAAPDSLATTPAGWMAVELPGPFEGYVNANALSKGLDVIPGSSIHLAPKNDAPVLATMAKGDKAEITGFHGKWTQVRLEKPLVGYIHVSVPAGVPLPSMATAPAIAAPEPAAPVNVTTAGKPAPMNSSGEAGSASLPRMFQGKFVSTKRAFAPKRPYDYQINDSSGVRVAYVDVSKLLQTELIERYLDHTVVVSGLARNVPDAKSIVIQAESLQLR